MKKNTRLYCLFVLTFALVNLFAFLLLFIPDYVLEADIGYFEYGRIFINKFIEFSLPSVAAAFIFANRSGWRSALLCAGGLCATRMIYLLPNYYLFFIEPSKVGYLYDSGEAIGLSLLVSIFGALLLFGQIILFYFIMNLGAKWKVRRSIREKLPPLKQKDKEKNLCSEIEKQTDKTLHNLDCKGKAFDISNPITLGIFCAVFVQFTISLVYEIVGTVEYLLAYAGGYQTGEIIYMMISYLFILLELIAVHALCCGIDGFVKEKERKNDSDEGKF